MLRNCLCTRPLFLNLTGELFFYFESFYFQTSLSYSSSFLRKRTALFYSYEQMSRSAPLPFQRLKKAMSSSTRQRLHLLISRSDPAQPLPAPLPPSLPPLLPHSHESLTSVTSLPTSCLVCPPLGPISADMTAPNHSPFLPPGD